MGCELSEARRQACWWGLGECIGDLALVSSWLGGLWRKPRFSISIAALAAEEILDKQGALDVAVERVPDKELTSAAMLT